MTNTISVEFKHPMLNLILSNTSLQKNAKVRPTIFHITINQYLLERQPE